MIDEISKSHIKMGNDKVKFNIKEFSKFNI